VTEAPWLINGGHGASSWRARRIIKSARLPEVARWLCARSEPMRLRYFVPRDHRGGAVHAHKHAHAHTHGIPSGQYTRAHAAVGAAVAASLLARRARHASGTATQCTRARAVPWVVAALPGPRRRCPRQHDGTVREVRIARAAAAAAAAAAAHPSDLSHCASAD
jgi:hypothetical protein